MKKILIAIPIILIALVLVLGFYMNSIIKSGVETIGSHVTGVPVKLNDVDISLVSGKGQLKGLSVGNPKGFKTERAFHLQEVKIVLDVQSIFSDKIIIKEILVNAPDITYEKSGKSDNIQTILNNIEAFAGGVKRVVPDMKGTEKEGKKPDKAERKIQINDFIVSNGKINMSTTVLQGRELSLDLKDIHIKDIGRDKEGTTLSKALEQVFAALNKNTMSAVTGSVADIGKTAEKTIGGAVDSLKGMFGK